MESLLLQYPKPRKDEWIGSWIFRIARANEVSLKQLFEHLGWADTEEFPDETRLLQLANVTREPVLRIEQMLKPKGTLIKFTGRSGAVTFHSFLGILYVQICPICISQDPVPYFRLSWLMRETYACPIHQTTMLDVCPHCDTRIMPPGSQHLWYRRDVDKDSIVLNNLRRCGQCNRDLGDFKRPSPVLSGLIDILPKKIGKQITPTESEWSAMVENTRRLIDHDGLYRLLDLSTLTLRVDSLKLPLFPANFHTADHHFGKELLIDILLGRRTENRRK